MIKIKECRKFMKVCKDCEQLKLIKYFAKNKRMKEEINAVNAYTIKTKIDIRIYVNNVIKNIKMELKNLIFAVENV